MTLVDLLNKYEAGTNVKDGKLEIELVSEDPEDFSEDNKTVKPGSTLDKAIDRLNAAKKYLDYHPHGREGGYVPWVFSEGDQAWYDEFGDCEWK